MPKTRVSTAPVAPASVAIRQPLEAVAMASESLDLAREALQAAVSAAHAAGSSWTLIGRELGVSRQAARQRFSGGN